MALASALAGTRQRHPELKKLAFESKDINSFDIRPLLLPFSWELIEVDKKLGSYKLKEYLKLIDEFF